MIHQSYILFKYREIYYLLGNPISILHVVLDVITYSG